MTRTFGLNNFVQVAKNQHHFKGEHFSAFPEWLVGALESATIYLKGDGGVLKWTVKTPLGDAHAAPGDFIVRNAAGELYPCKMNPYRDVLEGIV